MAKHEALLVWAVLSLTGQWEEWVRSPGALPECFLAGVMGRS